MPDETATPPQESALTQLAAALNLPVPGPFTGAQWSSYRARQDQADQDLAQVIARRTRPAA
ncbi:hypothetical protein [Actinoplanes sp. G11-F43]|uniref:hypothetical protein n=1 Tax=Actinoplanes sp. G11-F43 TaxID=3424130 RepID=UPI003D329ED8